MVIHKEMLSKREKQELDLLENETEVISNFEESGDNNESKEEDDPSKQQKIKVENPDDLFV